MRCSTLSLFSADVCSSASLPAPACLPSGRSVFIFLRILITLSCPPPSLSVSLNGSHRFRFQKSSMVL